MTWKTERFKKCTSNAKFAFKDTKPYKGVGWVWE